MGTVFDIQRFSVHDGPGIRTTVFLKGCPLRCAWCHNPESWSAAPTLSYNADTCLGCGACVDACPTGAHTVVDNVHVFDRNACTVCGACVDVCPSEALEMVGRKMSVADVLAEVEKDRGFYGADGGVTVSGGEPLAQADFTAAVLKGAKAAGLHTAVETCGYGTAAALKKILPHTDLFLFDLKAAEADHERVTGVERERITDNLRLLHDTGARIRLRLPVVPGYNASPAFLQEAVALLTELPHIETVELMPFHRLGAGKYARFGLEGAEPENAAVPTENMLKKWRKTLKIRSVDGDGR